MAWFARPQLMQTRGRSAFLFRLSRVFFHSVFTRFLRSAVVLLFTTPPRAGRGAVRCPEREEAALRLAETVPCQMSWLGPEAPREAVALMSEGQQRAECSAGSGRSRAAPSRGRLPL